MTDPNEAPDSTPDAPESEPQAPAPEAPAEETPPPSKEPEGPSEGEESQESQVKEGGALKRHEAQSRARQRARERQEKFEKSLEASKEEDPAEKARSEHRRRRDPDTGRYVPEGEEEVEEEAAGETPAEEGEEPPTAAEEEPPEGEAVDAEEGAEETPQPTRVKVDPEHPVAQMGVAELTATTPEEERAIRALLNGTYVRRQELEDRDTRLQKTEEQLEQIQRENVRLKSTQSAAERWKKTPEYRKAVEQYNEILEVSGQDAASKYWRGVNQDFKAMVEEEYEGNWGEMQQQRHQEQAESWVQNAWSDATSAVPDEVRSIPHFGRVFNNSVRLFDHALAEGHYPGVETVEQQHEAFQTFFRGQLLQYPAVRQALQEARARIKSADEPKEPAAPAEPDERAVEKAKDELKKEYAESRRKSPPNPLAGVGHSSGPDRARPPDDDGQPNMNNLPPHKVKRLAAQSARQRARERFNT